MRTVTYDPFGRRHAELTDPTIHPLRRTELLDALIVCEAEEIALGRRRGAPGRGTRASRWW